jgi:hypothetical protein
MKRVVTALLAVLYLSLASGVTVHAHYCMGKMIGATLAHAGVDNDGDHTCGLCGMKKSSDDGACCQDEEASFQVSEAQKGAVSTPVLTPFFAESLARVANPGSQPVPQFRDAAQHHWANPPPPRPPAVAIFLRVRNFRI